MPRLAAEGIFACLGPALKLFSRYSRVEKVSGEAVTLKEYLEHVWAAVAKEALSMILAGADATGFEPDARLTAMWLWTLSAGSGDDGTSAPDGDDDDSDNQDEGVTGRKSLTGGYVLAFTSRAL